MRSIIILAAWFDLFVSLIETNHLNDIKAKATASVALSDGGCYCSGDTETL
jgi:hypothetical protein